MTPAADPGHDGGPSASALGAMLGQRLLHGILLLLLLSLLSFALAELAPGDVVSQLELDPSVSRQTIDQLRARYALDRPWLERYGSWWRSLLRGDLGYSLSYHLPVRQLVLPRLCNTLVLTLSASLMAWFLALLLGGLAAWYRGGWIDRWVLTGNSVLLATPDLLLAVLALWLAARSGWFPLADLTSLDAPSWPLWRRLADRLWHLILPATTLALAVLPTLLAHVRRALVEASDAPFVEAARGHGVGEWRLFRRYALRSAANPLVTLLGFTLATLMSGSLIVEWILGWPGLGPLLLHAVLARDTHLVIAGALLSAAFLLLGNLLADLLLWHLDPRLRHPVPVGPRHRSP